MNSKRFGMRLAAGLGVWLVMAFAGVPGAWAQTEQTIYTFNCATDGCTPLSGLTWNAAHTAFYGTTSASGPNGEGTVFELTHNSNGWQYHVIFSFNNTTTGKDVYSNLTLYNGALYGAALYGGDPTCSCGVVFQLKEVNGTWKETILHNFTGGATDGEFPYGGVTFDSNGRLFGTTKAGGTSVGGNCGSTGCGTVYEMAEVNGQLKYGIIYNFQGSQINGPYDGAGPLGTLTFDASGNLYGTTCCSGVNGGNVFELSPAGGANWNYQTLFFFNGTTTGSQPNAGVVLDSQNNIYGTVLGAATAFELNSNGYNIIYNQGDVVDSYAPLVFDSHGNLFGTTYTYGDGQGDGSVFELQYEGNAWVPTVLHIFTGSDGQGIQTPVTLASDGRIFGTATLGGSGGGGLIYMITP